MATSRETRDLIAEARRLENDYGDNYEVMTHMSTLADALEAATSERAAEPDAATEKLERAHNLIELREFEIDNLGELITELRAERDAALAAVERVRSMHARRDDLKHPDHEGPVCDGCGDINGFASPWPCPTIAALDGAPEPEVKR